MRRHAFIFNPEAGAVPSQTAPEWLKREVRSFPGSKLFCSSQKGGIPELIAEISPDYDVFVACGGDGTIREMVSGLGNTTDKVVGIIPMGTANDLCKTLKISTSIPKAFDILRTGDTIKMDVGRCNDFIFLNSLGFGFDGLTNQYAHQLKHTPRMLQYLLAALRASFAQGQFGVNLSSDGRSQTWKPALMISFANGKVEGGHFWIAPQANINDNKLHLVMVKPLNRWLIPFLLPLFLIKKGGWLPQVSCIEIENIQLHLDENVAIHADGEIIKSKSRTFDIGIIPNSLEVICGH